jgi:hypothetical protein
MCELRLRCTDESAEIYMTVRKCSSVYGGPVSYAEGSIVAPLLSPYELSHVWEPWVQLREFRCFAQYSGACSSGQRIYSVVLRNSDTHCFCSVAGAVGLKICTHVGWVLYLAFFRPSLLCLLLIAVLLMSFLFCPSFLSHISSAFSIFPLLSTTLFFLISLLIYSVYKTEIMAIRDPPC